MQINQQLTYFDITSPCISDDSLSGNQALVMNTYWMETLANLLLELGITPCLAPLVLFLALGLLYKSLTPQRNTSGFFNHPPQQLGMIATNLNTTQGHYSAPAA